MKHGGKCTTWNHRRKSNKAGKFKENTCTYPDIICINGGGRDFWHTSGMNLDTCPALYMRPLNCFHGQIPITWLLRKSGFFFFWKKYLSDLCREGGGRGWVWMFLGSKERGRDYTLYLTLPSLFGFWGFLFLFSKFIKHSFGRFWGILTMTSNNKPHF